MSLRSISSASSGSLFTVSMKYSKPARPFRWAMFSIDPVDRLSRISTSCPWSSNASERWEPMKPAPPVINARTRDVLSEDLPLRRKRVHGLRDEIDVHARQRRLTRNRDGVMNQRLDAARGEMRLQLPARGCTYDEQMVHVAGVEFRDDLDAVSGELAAIPRRERAPARRPIHQGWQARAENRRLHLVEPRVDARLHVAIAVGLAAVAQPLQPIGQRRIAGDDGAA